MVAVIRTRLEIRGMASIFFEVECECEGVITRPEPDVGIFGPGVEDADLSSVSMLKTRRTDAGRFVWDNYDILDGLDAKSRDIVIGNIMKTYASEIDEAILSDA